MFIAPRKYLLLAGVSEGFCKESAEPTLYASKPPGYPAVWLRGRLHSPYSLRLNAYNLLHDCFFPGF